MASKHIKVSYRGKCSRPLSVIHSPIDENAIAKFDKNRLAQKLLSPTKKELMVLSLCNLRPVSLAYWASVIDALYQQSRRRIRVIHVEEMMVGFCAR